MTRLTCEKCRRPIPNGQAHIRSRTFRQVAFCGYCWGVHTILAAVQHAASTPARGAKVHLDR